MKPEFHMPPAPRGVSADASPTSLGVADPSASGAEHRAHALPELLAPVSTKEMLRAAIENGADAVYFGVQAFNARLRAANFELSELPGILSDLHERGVKGFLTLNTLIFADEIEQAVEVIRHATEAGVDGIIVQDIGVARLISDLSPQLELHASTQMTLSCSEAVTAARSLGLNLHRVVAPRELNLRELRKLISEVGIPVEVFVHGALCVAYSGQCLTSEALGGRSANRGECAQACRLPYDLIVDGEERDMGTLKYLLSPLDLAAYGDLPALVDIGVASLKIEGRLKSPEYVAATVQSYRAGLEKISEEAFPPTTAYKPSTDHLDALEMTFSRGFTKGYLHETNHQAVVEGRFSSKRGQRLGTVLAISGDDISLRLERPLVVGDGIAFEPPSAPSGDQRQLTGGKVHKITRRDGSELKRAEPACASSGRLKTMDITVQLWTGYGYRLRPSPGSVVWKTAAPAVEATLRASFAGDDVKFRRPVRGRVWAESGHPLVVELQTAEGLTARSMSRAPLAEGTTRSTTDTEIEDQLGRLGGTPFFLESLEIHRRGTPLIPFSWLNAARREIVSQIVQERRKWNINRPHQLSPDCTVLSCTVPASAPGDLPQLTLQAGPELSVLCRTLAQIETAAGLGVPRIYVDLVNPKSYIDARKLVSGRSLFVPATLQVLKPGEGASLRSLVRAEPDAILVRNLGALEALRQQTKALPVIGDFSLNVANHLTANLLLSRGLSLLTPSYDLNSDQLLALIGRSTAGCFEVTVHQHMPMFHMEHCVFCRFLSEGTNVSNCGRPCERHLVALRDRVGKEHPVRADAGCRNTVYNAVAQSAADYIPLLRQQGVCRFRVDLLQEPQSETERIIALYRSAILEKLPGRELWRELAAEGKLGVTRGSLDHSGVSEARARSVNSRLQIV